MGSIYQIIVWFFFVEVKQYIGLQAEKILIKIQIKICQYKKSPRTCITLNNHYEIDQSLYHHGSINFDFGFHINFAMYNNDVKITKY